MKRIIAFILSVLCIVGTLCGCSKKGIEFENEEAMKSYLKGVWKSQNGMGYLFFDDEKFFETGLYNIDKYAEKYFLSIYKDNGDFKEATVEEVLAYLKEKYADDNMEIDYLYSDGAIFYTKNNNDRCGCIVTENNIELQTVNGEKTSDDTIYTKISDSPDFSEELFGEEIKEIQSTYEISLRDVILSGNDLVEKLKERHPNINNFITVSETSDVFCTTDNGYATGFMSSFTYKKKQDDIYYIVYGRKNPRYTYEYYKLDDEIFTTVKVSYFNEAMIEAAIEEALLFVSRYPKVLTANQLLEKLGNSRSYNETIDGIYYQITVGSDGLAAIVIKTA